MFGLFAHVDLEQQAKALFELLLVPACLFVDSDSVHCHPMFSVSLHTSISSSKPRPFLSRSLCWPAFLLIQIECALSCHPMFSVSLHTLVLSSKPRPYSCRSLCRPAMVLVRISVCIVILISSSRCTGQPRGASQGPFRATICAGLVFM